jgi:hypothetical protein
VQEFRSRFVAPLIAWFALAACDEDRPARTDAGLACDPDAVPTLLASRADDEDGDGHLLDEDFPEIDDEDDDIADHAWIADRAGRYHLFFHNEGRGAPWRIEHYTSNDLRDLDYAGTALDEPPGTWDAGGAWAPHVIEVAGIYYMFYTGLDGVGAGATQRIGLAVSDDLTRWTRARVNRCPGTTGDGCLYECGEAWTRWGDAGDPANRQCRDSFVMRDEAHDRWLMFATARSTNGYGVVTVASSHDLEAWTGAGFIDATRRLSGGAGAQATGGQAENPFVVSRVGAHYLLFTDWQDAEDSLDVASPRTIVQYATAYTLDIDADGSAGWIYRGYTPDPGVNAIEVFQYGIGPWIMSQSLSNPRSGYVRPIRRMLRLKCVEWSADGTFQTTNVGFGADEAPGLLSPGNGAGERARRAPTRSSSGRAP